MLTNCYYPQYVEDEITENDSSGITEKEVSNDEEIKFELGLVRNVSGSAYLDFGKSKLMCSVVGPFARPTSDGVFSSTGLLECDVSFAASCETQDGTFDKKNILPNMIVDALHSNVCLDKYTKMVISINVIVLETDGNELAHAICCASLALLNAGVEMKDLVCASTAIKSEETIICEPTKQQRKDSEGFVTVASVPCTGDITQLWFDGKDHLASTFEMIQRCSERNTVLREKFKSKILEQDK